MVKKDDYEHIRSIAVRVLTTGQNLSLPIPTTIDEVQADVFFVHSVNLADFTPNRPAACLAVLSEEERVIDVGDHFFFAAIDFTPSEYIYPESYPELVEEARWLYADVRREVFSGNPSSKTARYIELIKMTAQPCLLPFYRAIAGSLFDLEGEE